MVRIPGLKVRIALPEYEYESPVYSHPRTPTEESGNGDYHSHVVCVLAYSELMASLTTFNAIYAHIWSSDSEIDIKISIFERDNDTLFIPANETPKYEFVVPASSFPSISSVNLIRLRSYVTIRPGKYVFIVFSNEAPGDVLNFKYWTAQSGSEPYRQNFLYGTAYTDRLLLGYANRYTSAFRLVNISYSQQSLESVLTELKLVESAPGTVIAERIILPDEISAVVGDTLQLFTRGMIESQNPYILPYEMSCSVGSAYPRYFELTPTIDDVGTKTLTVNVLDNDAELMNSDSTNIVIVNPTGQPSSNVNILCLGDSLLNGGVWPSELYRRLCGSGGTPAGLEYSNITFIGDQGSDPVKYIGYGGWTFNHYLGLAGSGSMITCTHDKDSTDQHSVWADSNTNQWLLESIVTGGLKMMPYGHTSAMPVANDSLTHVSGGTHSTTISYTDVEVEPSTPFWDSEEDEFSVAAWVNYAGYSGVDVLYVLLGWNNMTAGSYDAEDYAAVIANVRTFLDTFHTEYPSAVVRILGLQVPSVNGGLGTNYGATGTHANFFKELKQVNGLNLAYKALCDKAAYTSFVRFIAIAPQFDSENNMPSTTKVVNTRSEETEIIGTNGVHPANAGYKQIADAIFRDFIRTYCS